MDLAGKTAIITGAATRVGRTIALALADRGINVAFTYLDDSEPWRETSKAIEDRKVRSFALQMDVRKAERPAVCIREIVENFGSVDILVNNASIWRTQPFAEISLADWNDVMAINLTGPFLCSQAVAPYMMANGSGIIINLVDISVFQSWRGSVHHSVSKAGLATLTRMMAVELAPHIRVNAVAPGTVLLPDASSATKRKWAIDNSLMKRLGTPEDVARTVVHLCEADFVTGAIYVVDGGRSAVPFSTLE
jgi:pteridine reductase